MASLIDETGGGAWAGRGGDGRDEGLRIPTLGLAATCARATLSLMHLGSNPDSFPSE
jgi:hypothetical protein